MLASTVASTLCVLLLQAVVATVPAARPWDGVDLNASDSSSASAILERFAGLLRFKTVSNFHSENHVLLADEFDRVHAYLRAQWPLVFDRLEVKRVANFSLVVEWPGNNPSLGPLLFVSHLDVVPASEERWTHPPFSGAIADGYVWGRGSRDVKVGVAALLEAFSLLLRAGFEPERGVFLAFGHDEEVGGDAGAAAIADHFERRGLRFDLLVDEGGNLQADGFPPLTTRPLALVATGEKGYASLRVDVHASGGHSSVPPLNGTSASSLIAQLVRAVDRVPPPVRLTPPMADFLAELAPTAPWPLSLLLRLAHNPRAAPWLARYLAYALRRPELAALVRTTAACTSMAAAGLGDNLLPTSGHAVFNFRTLPGDPPDLPAAYLRARLADAGAAPDAANVSAAPGAPYNAPPPLSGAHGWQFDAMRAALLDVYYPSHKGLLVAPTLGRGGTDSVHYLRRNLTDTVYRITPITASAARGEAAGVHGIDERCAEGDFLSAVNFYVRLIRLAADSANKAQWR